MVDCPQPTRGDGGVAAGDAAEKNADDALRAEETLELERLVAEADRVILRKVHAAALLQWRGQVVMSK